MALLLFLLAALVTETLQCDSLQIENSAVIATFDGCTGSLIGLQRRGGINMLAGATTASSRGPFALWVDAPPPWLAVNALDHGTDFLDGGHRSCTGASCIALPNNGSGALTASDCWLMSHSLTYRKKLPMLTMTLIPKNTSIAALQIKLSATFAAAGPNPQLKLSLQIHNTGTTAQRLQVAFPLLRGVKLGAAVNGSANDLGILHMQTGIPGMAAWSGCPIGSKHIAATTDSCGGMLGYHHSSLWQQVYAADGSQGLSVIADEVSGQPRMMGRFGDGPASAAASSGTIYSMPYPGELLAPNASTTPASTFIIAHAGSWRVGAAFYRDWLQSVGAGQQQKSWFLHNTHSKGSCWFPSPSQVEQSKKSGSGMTSFTQLLEFVFIQSQMDMIECAMWWEMPEPDAYGAYSADGIFKVRQDLGGAAALAEGIKRVHAAGRRVQLYISADIVHRGSVLFNASWPASRWAMWWGRDGAHQDDGNGGGAHNDNATYMCHALESWQQAVADSVYRTVRDTGCDGVRLDGITNSNHECCWNPSHHHPHPFSDQGNKADLAIMRSCRAAIDALPGGDEVILSTEGFGDLYSLYGDTALMTWIGYPAGSKISPARITMPSFIGNTYGPYENVGHAALDGWNLATVSSPEEVGWGMLRESFAEVFLTGVVTPTDPIAQSNQSLALRMYDAGHFYLLVAAPVATSVEDERGEAISKLAVVTLPVALAAGALGIQTQVATLVSSMAPVVGRGWNTSVPCSALSTTIFPKGDPEMAFLDISPTTLPLTIHQGGSIVLALTALAPWWDTPNATINVIAFGLSVNVSMVCLQPTAWVKISAPAHATPGVYLVRFTSVVAALPARRWVHVAAMPKQQFI